ncbi:type IV secretion system DNA-binding domain-containing protein [Patescibacteria group bacterium]|nr:type IV secretion system DNA-binding domain-containing protein [Patescibacteria group bacterium]
MLNIYFWIGIFLILLIPLSFVARIFTRRSYNRFNPFDMITLRVLLPKESLEIEEQGQQKEPRQMIAQIESLMANLAGMRAERGWNAFWFGRRDHFAFEIVADEGVISFYVTIPIELRQFVEQQIQAQQPDAYIEEREDYNIFNPQCAIAGLKLEFKKSYFFPIQTYREMETDPLNALTNSLSKFKDGKGGAAIQYVVRSAHPRWHGAGNQLAREVRKGKKLNDAAKMIGNTPASTAFRTLARSRRTSEEEKARQNQTYRTLSQFEEEAIARIQGKTAKSGFEANIRIVVAAENESVAQSQVNGIADAFAQYSGQEYGNQFRKIIPQNLDKFLNDFIYRNFIERRQMILNTEEMASLFHFPLPTAETPNILWLNAKQAAAPVNIPKEGIILGHNEYRGQDTVIRLKKDDRRRHLYVIGKSGVGKSALISNLAKQDIEAGHGVCVIDPHGDLVDTILSYIPDNRLEDVIYFDPSDTERPMGLNMLEYKDEGQKDFAVQDMIAIFMKLFPPEMIGPMFEHNMRNVMLTLMADKDNPGTVIDIPAMFTNDVFQKYKVSKLKDPTVKAFWEEEMAKTAAAQKSEMLGYLVSKVGRFVENEMLRNIIGQQKSAFDFRDVMDNKKILLINLAKGKTGEINSSLLGLIIVSKLQMAAMSRADLPEEQRHDFYLYIDEFQNFVTDSIATILSEARKYRLNLIIAHQYIGQLFDEKQNPLIRDAVFGNVGTIASFKIGVEDAEVLAKEFTPVFNEYDVINVDKFHAYVKLLVDNAASKPFQMKTYPPEKGNPEKVAKLKEFSRLKFGVEKAVIEEDINARRQLGKKIPTNSSFEEEMKKAIEK